VTSDLPYITFFFFLGPIMLIEGRVVRAPPSPASQKTAMSPLYNKADCHHQSRAPGWAPGWHIRPNPTTPQRTSPTRGVVEPGFTGMESPGGSHHFFASLPPARSQMSIDTAEIMKSLHGLSLSNLFLSIFQHVFSFLSRYSCHRFLEAPQTSAHR
jgi:hypothetical protein